jgi:hypothetical protein
MRFPACVILEGGSIRVALGEGCEGKLEITDVLFGPCDLRIDEIEHPHDNRIRVPEGFLPNLKD